MTDDRQQTPRLGSGGTPVPPTPGQPAPPIIDPTQDPTQEPTPVEEPGDDDPTPTPDNPPMIA